jgi:hypothetical protein
MRRVVFARPEDFDRSADRPRGFDRRRNEVDLEPTAEAAAKISGVDEADWRDNSVCDNPRASINPASRSRGERAGSI